MNVIEINPGILVLLLGLAWFIGGVMGTMQERERWRSRPSRLTGGEDQ